MFNPLNYLFPLLILWHSLRSSVRRKLGLD
jgi:hypothetical protein